MTRFHLTFFFFFFNDTATTEIYTLSLHDALPICCCVCRRHGRMVRRTQTRQLHHHPNSSGTQGAQSESSACLRSEEHTSELQSRLHLVCRLLLEKKKKLKIHQPAHDIQFAHACDL